MAAREDGREDAVQHRVLADDAAPHLAEQVGAVQHRVLADDAAPHLAEQVGARGGEPLEQLNVAGRGRGTGDGGRVWRHGSRQGYNIILPSAT